MRNTITHVVSRSLLTYWNRQRGSSAAPLRDAIDPCAMRGLLPHLFILESRADGETGIRLAGTALCQLFERELRGECFAGLWVDGSSGAADDPARTVLDSQAPHALRLLAETRAARGLPMEMLLLPLAPRANEHRRVLGSLVALERPGWLGFDPCVDLVAETMWEVNADFEVPTYLFTRTSGHDDAAPHRTDRPDLRLVRSVPSS